MLAQSATSSPAGTEGSTDPHETVDWTVWKQAQADHHHRMAKLSDAYAAAYEGDVQFAKGRGQRSYLVQRARGHRKDAQLRRAAALGILSPNPRTNQP